MFLLGSQRRKKWRNLCVNKWRRWKKKRWMKLIRIEPNQKKTEATDQCDWIDMNYSISINNKLVHSRVSDSSQFLLMSIITHNQHFAWIWMRKTNENYSLFFVTSVDRSTEIYLWRHFLSHLFRCVKWDQSSLAIFKSSKSQGPISHIAITILCGIFFVKHDIPSEIHRSHDHFKVGIIKNSKRGQMFSSIRRNTLGNNINRYSHKKMLGKRTQYLRSCLFYLFAFWCVYSTLTTCIQISWECNDFNEISWLTLLRRWSRDDSI